MRYTILTFVFFLISTAFSERLQLYKGQLHCHSTQSDGTYDPDTVASRYKKAGYDFISLTDHSMYTDISHWNSADFLTLSGDEISTGKDHVNAFEFTSIPIPSIGVQGNINAAIEANSAFIQVNHPYSSGHTHQSLMMTNGFSHLELFNTRHYGEEGYSLAIWDTLLSNGRKIYGTACDDFHYDFKRFFNRNWIEVFAISLKKEEILRAIKSGDFFACHGKALIQEVAYPKDLIEVTAVDTLQIRFYGTGGVLLKDTFGLKASCSTIGQDYVRAAVFDTLGNASYSQPYFTGSYTLARGELFCDSIPDLESAFLIEFASPDVPFDSVDLLFNDSLLVTLGNRVNSYLCDVGLVAQGGELKARFLSSDGSYYWAESQRIQAATAVKAAASVQDFGVVYNSQTQQLSFKKSTVSDMELRLYTVRGQLVFNGVLLNGAIRLPDLTPGIYYPVLVGDEKIFVNELLSF